LNLLSEEVIKKIYTEKHVGLNWDLY
jgi:hypothetical protein